MFQPGIFYNAIARPLFGVVASGAGWHRQVFPWLQ
jgi:hypothetical protein